MNINVTLIGQMITFAVLVLVTLFYIWPPLMKVLDERQAKIAKGLQDAEESARRLQDAEKDAANTISQSKVDALNAIKAAEARAAKLIEEAKAKAQEQATQLLERAKADIEKEKRAIKEALLKEVGTLVIACTEKLLSKEVGSDVNAKLLEKLIAETEK